MARTRSGFQPRSPRRNRGWEDGPANVSTNISGSGSVLASVGAQILGDGNTLARVRGLCTFRLHTAAAAEQGFGGAFGIGIANVQAFGAGMASLISPLTGADWDGWLYHRFIDVRSVTGTISDGVNAGSVLNQFEVDSKAMRKLKEDDVIYAAVGVVEEGVAVMRWEFDSRILLLLP